MFQTGDDTWVVVETSDERVFDLDPALLVALGITEDSAPEGVEIRSWGAFVDGNRHVAFGVEARGQRSALEAAFGVDLSDLPDLVLDFDFTYQFHLELGDPNQW